MSMLESLGVQPLARNSRHRQKTAAAMPRREALPFSLRAADETAAVSLIMSATSSTIFDGFVKSNLVPSPTPTLPRQGEGDWDFLQVRHICNHIFTGGLGPGCAYGGHGLVSSRYSPDNAFRYSEIRNCLSVPWSMKSHGSISPVSLGDRKSTRLN